MSICMNVTEGGLICVKKLTANSEAVNQEIASPEPANKWFLSTFFINC